MVLKEEEFNVLLSWFMVSDPWPLNEIDDKIIEEFLNRESKIRGYEGWVEAYHKREK